MSINLVFYVEYREAAGPDLTPWFALRDEFGVNLLGIEWKTVPQNEHMSQLDTVPSLGHALYRYRDSTHVFLSEMAQRPFSDFVMPEGDVTFYFGRNSRGFRVDLDDLEDVIAIPYKLPGGDLWAYDAARAVLEA